MTMQGGLTGFFDKNGYPIYDGMVVISPLDEKYTVTFDKEVGISCLIDAKDRIEFLNDTIAGMVVVEEHIYEYE